MTNSRSCRWGILGTANIARKNWKSIRNAPNSSLVAVASRSLERARSFILECQSSAPFDAAPAPVGSYEELLRRPDVDAVYIPLPTGIRKDWVVRAAEAGKHVLCEKPAGVTVAEVNEILEACRRNRVQFMDAVMFMHSERLPLMRRALDGTPGIGRMTRITSHFTFAGDAAFFSGNIRASGELEPLGCLGDLGWYNIRFLLWALGYQLPERVIGHILAEHRRPDSQSPVPTDFSAELFFANGLTSHFYCSFVSEIQQWAIVGGTGGYLHVSDFVLPWHGGQLSFELTNPVFDVRGCDFNMQGRTRRHVVDEYSNSFAPSQESNMVRNFAGLVLGGTVDESWGEIALKTQQVLDACLLSARRGTPVVL